MKKIEAIIRPEKVDEVLAALEDAGYAGIMITEIKGHGKQKGLTQQWRGKEYRVSLLPKVKIELVVKDSDAGRISEALIKTAKTGNIGDGKIFISGIDNCIRIRTEEEGDKAL
ncbi:MAG: P-II family nitrogen regulator [Spirochaetota bacterium]